MTLAEEPLIELIEHNCQLLDELCQAVSMQSERLLTHADQQHSANSIANHIRHICEHYTCLFCGISMWQADINNTDKPSLPELLVNYDNRPRNSAAFATVQAASASISSIIQQLRQLVSIPSLSSASFKVAMSTASDSPAMYSPSSIYRELQFLHGHGVHHLAIIGLLLQQIGIEMPRSFGTAASTLKFEKQN